MDKIMHHIHSIIVGSILTLFSIICWALPVHKVTQTVVKEQKSIFATITAQDITYARSRISGTIDGLSVDEGDFLERGQVIAIVIDEKQPLEIATVDSQLNSLDNELSLAKIEYQRISTLQKSGVASKAELDAITSKVDVLQNNIASLSAQRQVLLKRFAERQIISPIAGRLLKVDVTNGTVVQPGDRIAQIAAQRYLLRLRLPERHASYLKKGQTVDILINGTKQAKVVQIYPLIEQGRVTADIEFSDIENYFIGQRVKVSIPLYEITKLLIPSSYLYKRYGVNFVKLKDGSEIAVQTGQQFDDKIEILSGLFENDEIIAP